MISSGLQATALPLVVLLHAYGVDAHVQDIFFGLSNLVDSAGFLLALPEGTVDSRGKRFWNATDGCCNLDGSSVDDVAYLDAVIDDVSAHHWVDKKRVFVTGHSNGAFMSHRYACDRAARVAAFVALAGDDWLDTTRCKPSEPVAALQVHGDADAAIPYNGGALAPSARASMLGWAQANGCAVAPPEMGAPLDLDKSLDGAETVVEKWNGCKPGGAAELWTIRGAGHVPAFRLPFWPQTIWGWMSAHPKL